MSEGCVETMMAILETNTWSPMGPWSGIWIHSAKAGGSPIARPVGWGASKFLTHSTGGSSTGPLFRCICIFIDLSSATFNQNLCPCLQTGGGHWPRFWIWDDGLLPNSARWLQQHRAVWSSVCCLRTVCSLSRDSAPWNLPGVSTLVAVMQCK